MKNNSVNNVKLGIFVLLGAILLIIGLYSIGTSKSMFRNSFRLVTVFSDVNGLTVGNNVRYSGIDVGTVDKIKLVNDSMVRVEMLIDQDMKGFIRKNSVTSIGTDGLVGNKIINIFPGNSTTTFVDENDEIKSTPTVNTEDMLRTLEFTNRNISVISNKLKDITEDVSHSRGALYKVLMDSSLARSIDITMRNIQLSSDNLHQTSMALSAITNDLSAGKRTLDMILKDTTLSNNISVAVQKIREGGEKFQKITDDAEKIFAQIDSGKGSINVLLKDTAFANNLKGSMSNINEASKKLDEHMEALKHTWPLDNYYKKKNKKKK